MRRGPFIFIALLTALLLGCASGPRCFSHSAKPSDANGNLTGGLSQVLVRVKNGVTNYYVYGPGLLYEVTETATVTNTRSYIYDYRGSTVALTDDNGDVTDRIEYSLYGLTTYRLGSTDTPFLFNGKYGVQSDPNGLLNMRARYYNPYLCRFLGADPSGFGGGLNEYAYGNGNPVSLVDPFGLGAVGEMLDSRAPLQLNDHHLIDEYFSRQPVTFDDVVNGLLGAADDVVSTPWNMAYGLAGNINTAISGQDNAGNEVSGWSRAWATANVAATFVPLFGELGEGLAGLDGAAEDTETLMPQGGMCFIAGTLVATEQGFKSIENIETNDLVWSYDENTDQTSLNRVAKVFVRSAEETIEIQLADTSVTCTPEHPFWVKNLGWTGACQLQPGDLVETLEGNDEPVKSIQKDLGKATVYNFEVVNAHSYFVSRASILVHNACTPFGNAPSGFSDFQQAQAAHDNFEGALIQQTGTSKGDWFMQTAPGETGVDATYIGPMSRNPGFKYAELKPYSQSGLNTFWDQLGNWQLPKGRTQLFFYNRGGIIGSSGFNF